MVHQSENKKIGFWRRQRVGSRLYFGIGILLVFIVLMAAIINYQVSLLRREVDKAIEVNVEQVKLATQAKQAFIICYGSANKYLTSGDRNDRSQYEQSAKELSDYLHTLSESVTDSNLLLVTEKEGGLREITTNYNELTLQKIKADTEAGVSDTTVYNIQEELLKALIAHEEASTQVIESYNEYDRTKETTSNSYDSGIYGGGSFYGGDSFGDSYSTEGYGGSLYSTTDSFLMSPLYFENSAQVGSAINNIKDWSDKALEESQGKVIKIQHQVRTVMLILIVVGAVLVLLTAYFLGKSITGPITFIRDQLTAISAGGGDLSKRISINSRDEAGELAEAFNHFVASLQKMIKTVADTSREVADNSYNLSISSTDAAKAVKQIAETLEQVADGASTQSKNTADTVVAMNQLQGAIDQIARGAQEQAQAVNLTGNSVGKMSKLSGAVKDSSVLLAQMAESTASAAENGRGAVKEVVSGMERINSATNDVAIKVDELGNYSGEIGQIIAVIDEIADQTSLLALNAAIEAARAGEHGKGFAVVAEEVRNLAERSRNATKEIGSLITEIQNSITIAVESMSASTSEVSKGSEIALRAETSLDEILKAVEKTNEEIRKVMSISQDMAAGSVEVAQAIDRVAAVVEENTASSEEMAAGAEQVLSAVESIASISEESAAGVEEVTAATEKVNSTMNDMAKAANELTQASDDLKKLVDKFKV